VAILLITVVCIEIITLIIKKMVLEERGGSGDGETGRKGVQCWGSRVIRP
jgi:hypothetical protein